MSDSTLNNDNASTEDALKTFALAQDATNESEDAYANDTTEDSTNAQSIVSNAPRHGFERLDKSIMPFGGKQYPSNIEFDVRAANTAEIRHWSSLDDTANPRILLDYFNDIIDKCVKVLNGSTTDIKEADRLWFIFYIHELTFAEAEKPTILKCTCSNENCKHTWNSQLKYSALQYNLPSDKMLKYLNKSTGSFDIVTKSYGTITMNVSPTINVGKHGLAFMKNKTEDWLKTNKAFLEIAELLVQINSDVIESKAFQKAYNDWCSWDGKQISTMIELAKLVKMTIKPSIQSKCPKCNTISDQDFDLEGGIKSMFLPVSNIDSELL
jgi:hypothetical protein